jgi:aminoglycoside phosphotransferase
LTDAPLGDGARRLGDPRFVDLSLQDFGDLAVGDRWADLAIASLSLDWNFGEGHQPEFFDAYGIVPDEDRIR